MDEHYREIYRNEKARKVLSTQDHVRIEAIAEALPLNLGSNSKLQSSKGVNVIDNSLLQQKNMDPIHVKAFPAAQTAPSRVSTFQVGLFSDCQIESHSAANKSQFKSIEFDQAENKMEFEAGNNVQAESSTMHLKSKEKIYLKRNEDSLSIRQSMEETSISSKIPEPLKISPEYRISPVCDNSAVRLNDAKYRDFENQKAQLSAVYTKKLIGFQTKLENSFEQDQKKAADKLELMLFDLKRQAKDTFEGELRLIKNMTAEFRNGSICIKSLTNESPNGVFSPLISTFRHSVLQYVTEGLNEIKDGYVEKLCETKDLIMCNWKRDEREMEMGENFKIQLEALRSKSSENFLLMQSKYSEEKSLLENQLSNLERKVEQQSNSKELQIAAMAQAKIEALKALNYEKQEKQQLTKNYESEMHIMHFNLAKVQKDKDEMVNHEAQLKSQEHKLGAIIDQLRSQIIQLQTNSEVLKNQLHTANLAISQTQNMKLNFLPERNVDQHFLAPISDYSKQTIDTLNKRGVAEMEVRASRSRKSSVGFLDVNYDLEKSPSKPRSIKSIRSYFFSQFRDFSDTEYDTEPMKKLREKIRVEEEYLVEARKTLVSSPPAERVSKYSKSIRIAPAPAKVIQI